MFIFGDFQHIFSEWCADFVLYTIHLGYVTDNETETVSKVLLFTELSLSLFFASWWWRESSRARVRGLNKSPTMASSGQKELYKKGKNTKHDSMNETNDDNDDDVQVDLLVS